MVAIEHAWSLLDTSLRYRLRAYTVVFSLFVAFAYYCFWLNLTS